VSPRVAVRHATLVLARRAFGTAGLLGLSDLAPVTGAGIGVAVLDSGIAPHAALGSSVVENGSLVTGDPAVTDVFGHGTHIAGIIAGSGGAARDVTGLYAGGIAPDAQLVNVRSDSGGHGDDRAGSAVSAS
jgi:subtilisin family serine protease